jgi:rare lipoprotein A
MFYHWNTCIHAVSNNMTFRATSLATLAACLIIFFCGCGGKKQKKPPVARIGATQTGIASWYGDPYHGRRAANGEVYDMEKFTAAHRTLPFGTWVRVDNLTNGRQVEVRITDRGPFIDGRIIDLSRAGARAIELLGPGIAKVKLTIIRAPSIPTITAPTVSSVAPNSTEELYAVQAGSFRDKSNAERLRDEMARRHGTAKLVERDSMPPQWRVLVGRFETEEDAEALAVQIRSQGGGAFVVKLD